MHPDPSDPATGGSAVRVRSRAVRAAVALVLGLFLGCGTSDRAGDMEGDTVGAAGAAVPAASDTPAAPTALEVIDGAGRTVTLSEPARRIVSMMPSVTEWIIAFGAADRLVARTDYDDHPAVAALPSVGGGLTPSVEWLAARRPDLVVAWPDAPSRSLVARLGAMDIPVFAAPSETIEQGLETARSLGTLLGRDSAAEAAITEVAAGLDSVAAAVDGRRRPGVLFLIGLDPLMAAGPGTFLDQLVDRAGGDNVLADVEILWPQVSLEEIVRRAPEIVVIGSKDGRPPLESLAGRPGWRDVPAVVRTRVHAVDPNLVNRPGPGMDEAASVLARLIHGDLAGLPATTDPALDAVAAGTQP